MRKFLFNLKQRLAHPHLRDILSEMKFNESLSREEFLSKQQSLINTTMAICSEIPFYQQQAKKASVDLMKPGCLADMPTLTKAQTHENWHRMVHPKANPKTATKKTTSGSTGQKATFCRSKLSLDWGYATGERCKSVWSIPHDARTIRVWGRSFALDSKLKNRIRGHLMLWKDQLVGMHGLNANKISAEFVQKNWNALRKIVPEVIHGYASSIYLIAKLINQNEIPRFQKPLRIVILESEMVYDFQTEEIRRAFQCPVVEWYGCVEVGIIATPCRQGRRHIREDNLLVESIDGKIALTSLHERIMPLVRYLVGDEAILDETPCPCGLPFRTIKKLMGRSPDMIRKPDGTVIAGHMFTHIFDQFPNIGRFQVVQKTLTEYDVTIESPRPLNAGDETELTTKFRQLCGAAVNLRITYTESIPTESSGKYRWIRSELTGNEILGKNPT